MTTSIQWGEFCPEEVHHTVHRTYEYIFIIWRVLIFFVSLASFQFGIKHNRQKNWNDGGLHHDEVEEGGVVQGGDLVLARMLSSLLHLEEEHESRKQVIRVLLGFCPMLKEEPTLIISNLPMEGVAKEDCDEAIDLARQMHRHLSVKVDLKW